MTCDFINNRPRAIGAWEWTTFITNRVDNNFGYHLRDENYGPIAMYTVPKGRHACRLHAVVETFTEFPYDGYEVNPPSISQLRLVTSAGVQDFIVERVATGYNELHVLEADVPEVLTEGDRVLVMGRDSTGFSSSSAGLMFAGLAGVEHDDPSPPGRFPNVLLSESITVTPSTGWPYGSVYREVTVPVGAKVLSVNTSNVVGFEAGSDVCDMQVYDPYSLVSQDAWIDCWNEPLMASLACPVGPLVPNYFVNGYSFYGPFTGQGGPGTWGIWVAVDGASDHQVSFDLEISYGTEF